MMSTSEPYTSRNKTLIPKAGLSLWRGIEILWTLRRLPTLTSTRRIDTPWVADQLMPRTARAQLHSSWVGLVSRPSNSWVESIRYNLLLLIGRSWSSLVACFAESFLTKVPSVVSQAAGMNEPNSGCVRAFFSSFSSYSFEVTMKVFHSITSFEVVTTCFVRRRKSRAEFPICQPDVGAYVAT